jgi:hypothetical protein
MIVHAFRTLQAETGLTIIRKAAYNFLACALLTSTDDTTTAEMSLYIDKSYITVVYNFFTDVGYNVEMHKHELVFVKTGEDDQVINQIVLQVSQPDSFDSVDNSRNLPISMCSANVQVAQMQGVPQS